MTEDPLLSNARAHANRRASSERAPMRIYETRSIREHNPREHNLCGVLVGIETRVVCVYGPNDISPLSDAVLLETVGAIAPALNDPKACVWGRCNGTREGNGPCNRCGSVRT